MPKREKKRSKRRKKDRDKRYRSRSRSKEKYTRRFQESQNSDKERSIASDSDLDSLEKRHIFDLENEYKRFPPTTFEELRSSLLLYLLSPDFFYPVNNEILFENFLENFKSEDKNHFSDFKQKIENLSYKKILSFFQENGILTFQNQIFGFEIKEFVVDLDRERLIEYCKEFYKDRPKKDFYQILNETESISDMVDIIDVEDTQDDFCIQESNPITLTLTSP